MLRGFPSQVLDLIEAGTPVAEIAVQLVCQTRRSTIGRQDRIDRGLRAGVSTVESAELAAARKRVRELETELASNGIVLLARRDTGAVTELANELLKAPPWVPPRCVSV